MIEHYQYIQQQLVKREEENALRTLKTNDGLIDFCSNDYLGFSSEKEIHILDKALSQYGATGSRLISGNYKLTEEIEDYLTDFYRSESALIFNSGYNANIGLFSSLPQKGDTIIYDDLIHASIRDGIRLSHANAFSFKHNDIDHLEIKLKNASGNIYIAVESVYSMDGDVASLEKIIKLCNKYNAALIVDEAHAVGIYGQGKGLVSELKLENEVFARIITFGKAYGIHGATVLGNKLLKDYLINFSRAFIYTTALPLHSILSIRKAHHFLLQHKNRIETLKENIKHFQNLIINSKLSTISSNSAIQCVVVPGNNEVKRLAEKIQKYGFDVRPILSPTVPKGQERLRICLHSFNTKEEISQLITHLNPPSREDKPPLKKNQKGTNNNFYNKDLKPLARKNRKEMTKAELKIWNDLLRKKQCMGYKFLRQRPILNYIVDFMCPELKLIIEIDGYSHHFEEVYENDIVRQEKIETLGYKFIRFTDDEVMNDFNNIVRTLEVHLENMQK